MNKYWTKHWPYIGCILPCMVLDKPINLAQRRTIKHLPPTSHNHGWFVTSAVGGKEYMTWMKKKNNNHMHHRLYPTVSAGNLKLLRFLVDDNWIDSELIFKPSSGISPAYKGTLLPSMFRDELHQDVHWHTLHLMGLEVKEGRKETAIW